MEQSRLGSSLGCRGRVDEVGAGFKIRRFLWGFKGIRLHGSSLAAPEISLVLLQVFALLQGDLREQGFLWNFINKTMYRGEAK